MRTTTTVAVALLAAGLTACTSSTPAATSSPSRTASSTPSASPTPSPSPSTTGLLAFGTPTHWETPDFAGTTTVLGYKQPVASDTVQPEEDFGSESKGYVWASVEVKVCLERGSITVSNTPWSLAYADGARISPSSSIYSGFPQPEYPVGDTPVAAGDCVRGNITFPVPGKQRPMKVVYAAVPEGEQPKTWAVPEA